MKIEVSSKGPGTSLSGKSEVWVHVFANEMHDWPSIEKKLSDEQRAMLDGLGRRTLAYFPHNPLPEEREEHGYLCDDWFVWASVASARKTA